MARFENLEKVRETVGAHELIKKYPGRIPLIALRHASCPPEIKTERTRYLIPRDIQFGCIHEVIRRRIHLDARQSLFLFCKNSLLPLNQNVCQIYDKYANEDGFLYVYYSLENTFG